MLSDEFRFKYQGLLIKVLNVVPGHSPASELVLGALMLSLARHRPKALGTAHHNEPCKMLNSSFPFSYDDIGLVNLTNTNFFLS